MIHESHAWKEDLLKYRNTLQEYNNAIKNRKTFIDTKENIFALIEKCIFYSAFVIRKLIECKHKVSEGVDNYSFRLTYDRHN